VTSGACGRSMGLSLVAPTICSGPRSKSPSAIVSACISNSPIHESSMVTSSISSTSLLQHQGGPASVHMLGRRRLVSSIPLSASLWRQYPIMTVTLLRRRPSHSTWERKGPSQRQPGMVHGKAAMTGKSGGHWGKSATNY
jgi:hypothetical protein